MLSCGAPKKIVNGTITGSRFQYKDQITYKCNPGSGLSGNDVRTCQLNGLWSGIDPSCICKYLKCISNKKRIKGCRFIYFSFMFELCISLQDGLESKPKGAESYI